MNKPNYNTFILLGMILLVTIVPLAYSSKIFEMAIYPKLLVMNILILILTIVWFLKVYNTPQTSFHPSPLILPIGFYLLVSIFSVRQAINLNSSLYVLSFLLMLIILFFIVLNNVTLPMIFTLFRYATLAGAFAAIIGIAQYLGWGFYWIPSSGLPSSTFAYRNMAAMVMIMVLPFGIWCFLSARGIGKELLWGLATTSIAIFLLYTRTRGAWLGFLGALIISIIIILLLRRNRSDLFVKLGAVYSNPRKSRLFLIFLILIVIMAQFPPSERVAQALGGPKATGIFATSVSIFGEGGGSGRLTLWKHIGQMLQDNYIWLTGVGLGNYQYNYPQYSDGFLANIHSIADRPHNDYLWIWTETGIMGLITYLWLLGTVFGMAVKILKTYERPQLVLLAIISLSSITAILGHAFFSFPKERITPSMLLWVNFAIIGIIHEIAKKKKEPYPILLNTSIRQPRLLTLTLLGSFIIVSLGSTEISRRWLLHDYHFQSARQYNVDENYPAALQEIAQAESYGHLNYRTPFLEGIINTKLHKYNQAIQAYKHCLRENPTYLNALYNLGVTYYKVGEYGKAGEYFLTSITIDPNFYNAHVNLAASLQRIAMYPEAIYEYNRALELKPDSEDIYNNLGIIYSQQGQLEKSIEMFRLALDINPENQKVKENLMQVEGQFKLPSTPK